VDTSKGVIEVEMRRYPWLRDKEAPFPPGKMLPTSVRGCDQQPRRLGNTSPLSPDGCIPVCKLNGMQPCNAMPASRLRQLLTTIEDTVASGIEYQSTLHLAACWRPDISPFRSVALRFFRCLILGACSLKRTDSLFRPRSPASDKVIIHRRSSDWNL
jgi:hypothetical protein